MSRASAVPTIGFISPPGWFDPSPMELGVLAKIIAGRPLTRDELNGARAGWIEALPTKGKKVLKVVHSVPTSNGSPGNSD